MLISGGKCNSHNCRTIGVVGVDAPLDQIENILARYQWGQVSWFIFSKNMETIYHPHLSFAVRYIGFSFLSFLMASPSPPLPLLPSPSLLSFAKVWVLFPLLRCKLSILIFPHSSPLFSYRSIWSLCCVCCAYPLSNIVHKTLQNYRGELLFNLFFLSGMCASCF